MIRFCLLSSLLCLASTAWANPDDVGTLRPHHQLELPQKPEAPAPLPEPENQPIELESENAIQIQESASLLAQHGNLNPQATDFRANAWQYMDQVQATKLLERLPNTIAPSALREAVIDLLRMRTDPPVSANDAWFNARVEALTKIGAHDRAGQLVSSVPGSLSNSIDPLALFQALLQSSQKQLACESIQDRPKPDDIDPEQWQRIRLYCEGVRGNFPKIEVSLAIAEERGSPYSNWFVTLLEHLQYQSDLPELNDTMSRMDQVMVEAAQPTSQETPEEEKPFAKKAKNAVSAIIRHIRAGELAETNDWLALLDRAEGDSARNYVLHELVRFLRSDRQTAKSPEAMKLPPFINTQSASAKDKTLLKRFFATMQSFDYEAPSVTQDWLADTKTQNASSNYKLMQQLGNFARTGNSAGYVLALASLIEQEPLNILPNGTVSAILFDLKQLRQENLAKSVAAEAILSTLQ